MIKAIIVLLIIFIGIRLVRATVSAILRRNREYRERQEALGKTGYLMESGHVLSELDETLERNQAAKRVVERDRVPNLVRDSHRGAVHILVR